jgi:hypothetical protein
MMSSDAQDLVLCSSTWKELMEMYVHVKPIPGIQKVHSLTVLDVDLVECKHYSISYKRFFMFFK